MLIVQCPTCSMRIVPKKNGHCPACLKFIPELPGGETSAALTGPESPQHSRENELPQLVPSPFDEDPRPGSLGRSVSDPSSEFDQVVVPDLPDAHPWSPDWSGAQPQWDPAPRQISPLLRKKSLMSRILPRAASEALAKVIGYGCGGISLAVGIVVLRTFRMKLLPMQILFGIGLILFGTYLIAMARREA